MKEGRGRKRSADEAFADDPQFDKIAPDGVVTFILDEGKMTVRVHSAIMKNASPVFAAMLGPHFKEGHALREGGCEIPLPEDDGVVFAWICRVLHCQNDTYSWQPEPKEIVQVLDVAEKYDLSKGILLSVRVWVGHQLEHTDTSDLWSLLLACHRAQDGDSFESISRKLLLSCAESFVQLAADTKDAGRTAYRLAATLEVSRNEVLSKIFWILHVDLPDAIRGYPCRHDENPNPYCMMNVQAGMTLHLHHNDTSRSINQGVDLVLDALSKLCKHTIDCEPCIKYRGAMCRSIHYTCVNIEEKVKGLCLACFDRTSTGKCTNEHGKSLVAPRPVGYT
ncbi:hypothetical protein BHE90_008071 [Fusarium euwallaceae]|uniref:BTB domain-containing protein n=1 Tax=Fusarium euwallaceae TaxID=1147111 RepID=A0A430LP19_9HYPO|nr:hypothetical protein BHE90_008071 [Fusarium euwallaceae]